MTPTQIDNTQKWVNALRSGKYTQGIGALHTQDNTYCCLGVVCNLYNIPKVLNSFGIYEYTFPNGKKQIGVPDGQWFEEIFGFGYDHYFEKAEILVDMNDERGMTFAQIADVIEKEFLIES